MTDVCFTVSGGGQSCADFSRVPAGLPVEGLGRVHPDLNIQAGGSGNGAQFYYDPDGNRVKTVRPDGSVVYTPFPNYEEEFRSPRRLVVRARGSWSEGWPRMQLRINGVVEREWLVDSSSWRDYAAPVVFQGNDQIEIVFPNDYGVPGVSDRNLYVDKITIDGATYETEAPTTWSTGTWTSPNGCDDAYKQSESLHCTGYFRYDGVTTTAGGSLIRRSTYSIAGQPVATRVTGDPDPANNGRFYIHSDHLGSASALTKYSDGAIVGGSLTRYTPFGSYRSGGPSQITDRAYTGQRENMDLGLYYYNARYYTPGIGRFLSADTLVPNPQNPQALNRYAYVLNRPLNFSDPTGHCANEFYDTDCWNEYDSLVEQFLANSYTKEQILELIGTGEDYVYKDMRIIDIFDRYRNCGGDFDCSNNSPRPYDPYEYTCDWQYWEDCYQRSPLFDFVSVTLSLGPGVGPTLSLIVDKYGNAYITGGFQVGFPTGASGSIAGGKLMEDAGHVIDDASEQILEKSLSGYAESLSGGAGAGVSVFGNTLDTSTPDALEVGVYTPQLSYTFASYTFLFYDNGSDAPWIWQKWTSK